VNAGRTSFVSSTTTNSSSSTESFNEDIVGSASLSSVWPSLAKKEATCSACSRSCSGSVLIFSAACPVRIKTAIKKEISFYIINSS